MSGLMGDIGAKSGRITPARHGLDYDEGTWTPVVSSGGSMGTVQYARYVRIGNVCNVSAYMQMTGNSGSAQVFSGLPYKTINHVTGSLHSSAAAFPTQSSICRTEDFSYNIFFYYHNGGQVAITGNHLINGHLMFNITYITGDPISVIGHTT